MHSPHALNSDGSHRLPPSLPPPQVRQSRLNLAAHSANSATPGAKTNSSAYGAQTARKEDLRLTRMMLTIFLCFLVSFLPLMIVNVADDDVSRSHDDAGNKNS